MTELAALLSANAIPVTKDSRLLINIHTADAADQIATVTILQLSSEGAIINSVEQFTYNGASNPTTEVIQLTSNKLVSVSIATNDTADPLGRTYARIILQSGSVAQSSNQQLLTSGSLSAGNVLNYPLSVPRPAYDYTPTTANQTIANPAAGAGFSDILSASALSKLIAGRFRLVASAAAANRVVTVTLVDAFTTVYSVTSRTAQTASQTRDYIFWRGANLPADVGTIIYLPLAELPHLTELLITATVAAIDVADQISGINLYAEMFAIPAS